MNVLAILGIRWFMFAAKFGASSVLIWIIAAFLFFIPIAFICAEFGAAYPDKKAGIADWIKEELGEKVAFFVSWFYLVAIFFWLPTALTFIGICIAYAIDPSLASNKIFISSFVLIVFWGMLFLGTKSLNLFKKISETNCFIGIILPILLLIIAAIISVLFLHNKIPTSFAPHEWIPNFNSSNILFVIGISAGMIGAEISAPFISRMSDPQKRFPLAILLAAFLIIACYIISTLSILFVIPPSGFDITDGIFKVIHIIFCQIHMEILAVITFVLMAIGGLGGVMIWIVSPAKMFIDGNDPKIFPKFITRKTKDDLPLNAMIVQGIFITIIVLVGDMLPSVSATYQVMITAFTILLFLVYILLAVAYIKMKFTKTHKPIFAIPGKKVGAIIASFFVIILCSISIIVPVVSIPSGSNAFIYELEVIGIPLLFIFLGFLLYRRKRRE